VIIQVKNKQKELTNYFIKQLLKFQIIIEKLLTNYLRAYNKLM